MSSEVSASRRPTGHPGVEESRRKPLGGQRILITGATGQLGRYLVPTVRAAGATVLAHGRFTGDGIDVAADLADRDQTLEAVDAVAPDVIIHAAACTDVDGIELDPARGELGNVAATRHVARAASAAGAYLISVSTDMVFPGDGGAPYAEEDPTRPISAYGRSKLAAEREVLTADPSFAVARTAWLYGGAGKHFPRTVLTVLRDRGTIAVVADELGSPTFAGDLAKALVSLAAMRGRGVFHLVNGGRASRFALARAVARLAGLEEERVHPTSTVEFLARFPLPAPRPPDSSLQNRRAAALGISLPEWDVALGGYVPSLTRELGLAATNSPVGGD
jgi:dTDP-4-dehydrorhamnose reductase